MATDFVFSIIIAVYNCAPFLQETLQSIVEQSYGLQGVQVILVDDGSQDESGAICDAFAKAHPQNAVVIHKENGGVSSARNAGGRAARGKYLNFLDSDDKLSPTALADVYAFFQKYPDEADVVTIPIEFFDAAQGPHWLNGKFDKGTRVIDLDNEPYHCVLSTSASFYPNRVKPLLVFEERQRVAEDAVVNARLLTRRARLGVVDTCRYLYRRRSVGSSSAIQSATKKKWYYLDYMRYFVQEAVRYARASRGCVPKHIQFALACDLHWRIRSPQPLDEVLTPDEQQAYIRLLHWAYDQLDDEVIVQVPGISQGMYYDLLYFKRQEAEVRWKAEDANVLVRGTPICCVGVNRARLELVCVRNGALDLEGTLWQFSCERRDLSVWVCVEHEKGRTVIPCQGYERADLARSAYDVPLRHVTGFRARIELARFDGIRAVSVYQGDGQHCVRRKHFEASFYSALGARWPTQYVCEDGYILSLREGTIRIERATRMAHLRKEMALLGSLLRSPRASDRKAAAVRCLYWLGRKALRRRVWIVSDKAAQADDNGEAFFRFLCDQKPKGIRFYFMLEKDAEAYPELARRGRVLPPSSKAYKVLYLLSSCVISSQADRDSTNPFHDYWQPYQDLLARSRSVFLQHGIIKDDLSNWLNRRRQNLSGFVTSTREEYRSILEGGYGYTPKELWLTGLPRFDRLYNDERRVITIMPTWRRYLLDIDREHGGWVARENFFQSDFFRFYEALLRHPRLLDAARQYGYQLHFRPHPNILRYADRFVTDDRVVVDPPQKSYRETYAQSNLIVSDYSSAVMDFAYLKKPVVYCHFDAEEFFGGKHMYVRGYYDYERDGFGEVEYELESLVSRIVEYMRNDCALKPTYRERIERFFCFNDHENCQRVYEKLMELENTP